MNIIEIKSCSLVSLLFTKYRKYYYLLLRVSVVVLNPVSRYFELAIIFFSGVLEGELSKSSKSSS